jgi:preprotein translocase SecE subunit
MAQRQQSAPVPLPRTGKGPRAFYRDIIREMKHVSWPSQRDTTRLTGVVFAVCGLVAGLLFVLSLFFEQLLKILVTGGR